MRSGDRRVVLGAVVGLAALFCVARGASADDALDPRAVATGRAFYVEFCARCHGDAGRGDGPDASRTPAPPDLTAIALRNGGVFDVERVRARVDGRGMPKEHGTRTMPIWGEVLGTDGRGAQGRDAERPEDREGITKRRIWSVAQYLRSIQRSR
ncbi:c-type cytochrome [Myxococcota bacterium]|nr:c-type cytochrome [Myxococcota bacterium]